ncbi:hypothetical protein CR513_02906, partial [Mucuna pruriens]
MGSRKCFCFCFLVCKCFLTNLLPKSKYRYKDGFNGKDDGQLLTTIASSSCSVPPTMAKTWPRSQSYEVSIRYGVGFRTRVGHVKPESARRICLENVLKSAEERIKIHQKWKYLIGRSPLSNSTTTNGDPFDALTTETGSEAASSSKVTPRKHKYHIRIKLFGVDLSPGNVAGLMHKQERVNIVADAFFGKHVLLAMLETKLLGLSALRNCTWKMVTSRRHEICDNSAKGGEKSKVSPHGLYTSLPIPTSLGVDISIDVVLGFPIAKGGQDSIFVVVDRVVNTTTSHSPFEIVHGFKPLTSIDLLPLPDMASRLNMDKLSKAQFIKKLHERVRSHIEKKVGQYSKQANRGTLPPNLRKNSLLEGEHDVNVDQDLGDTQDKIESIESTTLQGPMTRGSRFYLFI